jgi:dTDP-4-amino-4,6-dideoxygalactose transaminase
MADSAVIAPIPFIDVVAQRRRLGARLDEAVKRVLDHGRYILGPEVAQLEARLAAYCGARHALSCSNGTDALSLALRAKGVGPGDGVLVPALTFAATAEVVALCGATPVFVDVEATSFNLDPERVEEAIATARRLDLRAVAIITVDLFGQPADIDAIEPIARAHGLWILADAAQSFGASWRGRRVGTMGLITATSFFPSKPLSCFGDGGAVFTDDDGLRAIMESLRVHGQGADKYENVRIGINGRMDTLQAAIVLEKLTIFDDEIAARQRIANAYNDALGDVAVVPRPRQEASSVWAQYTLRLPGRDRDQVARRLSAAGIPTAVYYPRPLNRQPAYARFPAGGTLPVSERLSGEVLSLPMHPYLDAATQARVIDAVRAALR